MVKEIFIKKKTNCASMKNVISCSIRISVFTGAFHINNFHFCLTVEFDELYVNAIISTTRPSCQKSF